MLLLDQEPGGAPPDDDSADETYSKTMRLLLAAKSDRSHFSANRVNMGSAALCGVNLDEVGTWAVATHLPLPADFPRKAPRKGAPVKWRLWLNIPELKLWEAVALVTDTEPTSLRHSANAWMLGAGHGPLFEDGSFPSPYKREQFTDAMRLAEGATSTAGPIFWRTDLSPRPKANVSVVLGEVASFFAACNWPDMPPEIRALASQAVGGDAPAAETKEEREDRRLKACEAAGLTMPMSADGRLPDGIGKVAAADRVTRQTFSDDVRAALRRRKLLHRSGSTPK